MLRIFDPDVLILFGLFLVLLFVVTRGTEDGSDVFDDAPWRPTLRDKDGEFPGMKKPDDKWK